MMAARFQKVRGTLGYPEDADRLFEQYEKALFEDAHRRFLDLYPEEPSRVLDVGSGSGRDAAAFARLGHQVTAVEPTEELLSKARLRHRYQNIAWVQDHLPELDKLRGSEGSFQLIVLYAVWMHLGVDE